MSRSPAKTVALGGVLGALAMVFFCIGGLIPIATYTCPVLCALLLKAVLITGGRRMAWTWYAMVSLMALLFAPDKESAFVFLFLGYYPIVKPALDKSRLKWLWKLLLFNGAVAAMYAALLLITGTASILQDYREMGLLGLAVMLILGNLTFFLLDVLLGRKFIRKRRPQN